MTSRRLVEVLLGASLIAGAPGCLCPDQTLEDRATVLRGAFAPEVDACLADDRACETLCRAALGLDDEARFSRCVITAADAKHVTVEATYAYPIDCVGGRRPAGLREPHAAGIAGDAAWLARVAAIEAASVTAFARLVGTLTRLGAPATLRAAARRAIADELVHAQLVAGLAVAAGARVEPPVIAAAAEPSLEQLATENAVEGQVAETFGALVAACQAQLAPDPRIRAVFARIARDEAAHAALAHQLAPWLAARLDRPARARVADARRAAIDGLLARPGLGLDAAARAALGVPPPARLRAASARAFAALAA
jgi:hypothetical protein